MNTYINRGDWIVKNSKEVYDNPWITVRHSDVITPGDTDGIYGEVNFKNLAIGIIPIDQNGYTWRVGQFRFPLNTYSWEIPEGGGPIGIDPLESAKRELLEEVGYTAEEWIEFLQIDLSNSVINERAVIFLAESLTFLGTNHEDIENFRLECLHFNILNNQVIKREITDSISVAAVLKLAVLRPEFLEIKK